jgi:hypothetical protein|eukprot:SAG25_NODE_496_length_7401_cov_8.698439_3_plen_76_part_00
MPCTRYLIWPDSRCWRSAIPSRSCTYDGVDSMSGTDERPAARLTQEASVRVRVGLMAVAQRLAMRRSWANTAGPR